MFLRRIEMLRQVLIKSSVFCDASVAPSFLVPSLMNGFTLSRSYYLAPKYDPESKKPFERLDYVPQDAILSKSGRPVVFDYFKNWDKKELYLIMKDHIDSGLDFPQEEMDEIDFSRYFLSHEAYVLRDISTREVLSGFFLKPNFPNKSSHICHTGLLVKKNCRNCGIATYMLKQFLRIARDRGYRSVWGNLLYAPNKFSFAVREKLGYKIVGGIPKGGYLKGHGYITAYQTYFDLTKLDENGAPPDGWNI